MRMIRNELRWVGDFVALGPGSFTMGAGAEDRFATSSEFPRRRIEIGHQFAIAVFPLTEAQWNFQNLDGLPRVGISWHDIEIWLQRARDKSGLPLRFPSEAEWEFAARAHCEGGFPNGGTICPSEANFLHDDGKGKVGPGRLTARGTYPPNSFGIEDMLGNVAEWVADHWWPDLARVPKSGKAFQEFQSDSRVVRSAGWDALPRLLRLSARHPLSIGRAQDNLGFRLAYDLL